MLPCNQLCYAPLMLELEATHSHLCPGARGRVATDGPAHGPIAPSFADGVRIVATLDGERLGVPGYATARDTEIGAKP
jgi:hypothetical protein